MKEGIRKAYRFTSWEFADYLDWRPQLRGNTKKRQKRIFTKGARRNSKKIIISELNNDNN